MEVDAPAKPRSLLQRIAATAPSKSMLATGFLCLMWGPILVSFYDAMTRVSHTEAARSEASDPLSAPSAATDPVVESSVTKPIEASYGSTAEDTEQTTMADLVTSGPGVALSQSN